jgi:hypothetical protein
MSYSRTLLAGTTLSGFAFAAMPAMAGVCPGSGASGPAPAVAGGSAGSITWTTGGCNLTITYGPNGTISTAAPGTAGTLAYDSGGDDALVGIKNNSGHSIASIFLKTGVAADDIMNFDGDGIGAFTGVGTNALDGSTGKYGGRDAWFIVGSNTSGTVNFLGGYNLGVNNSFIRNLSNGGIPNGDTAYFSLEAPIDINALPVSTPEPASLAILGAGLAGLGAIRRRKRG